MSLTPNTKTTLHTVGIIVGVIVGVVVYAERKFASQDAKFAAVLALVEAQSREMQAMKAEQYTVSMAVEQAFRLAMANPRLSVPDPRNPSVTIQVRDMEVTANP